MKWNPSEILKLENSAAVLQKHRYVQTWFSKFHYLLSVPEHTESISCTKYHTGHENMSLLPSSLPLTTLPPCTPGLIHKTRKGAEDRVLTNIVLDAKWAFQRSLSEHINEGINKWANTLWQLFRSLCKYPPSTLAQDEENKPLKIEMIKLVATGIKIQSP